MYIINVYGLQEKNTLDKTTFMIPTNSSGTTNGCDNISSNCVVWQGPDIACIDLCSGDTISEVTAKIAVKVCDLITNGVVSNPTLTGLDLTCLNIPGLTPTTLVPVLQAMVVQICANASGGSSSIPVAQQVQNDLPVMTLPACLQYNDANGNPVTELRLDLFATLIAQQVCTNLASITTINSTLTSYSSRLDILEACVLPCSGSVTEVQIIPTCVSNVGQLTNVSVVVLALESAYCTLVGGTGTVAQMNLAIGQSTLTSASPTRENSSATYSSIGGWNASPTTLAQSLQNAWVVIDDLYAAVGSIQTNCCASGCSSVIFNYTTLTSTTGNGTISNVNFNFLGSTIPNTFNDSSGFSLITLTDALGGTLSTVVSVSSLQTNTSGFDFSTGSLNTQQDISATVNFSVTDGVDTCTSIQSNVIPGLVPCVNALGTSGITTTGVTVTFNQSLGTTATYVIDIIDPSNTVVATTTINNPGTTVTHSFTGLISGTIYSIKVTTTFGGATAICPEVAFSTVSATTACDFGMDVAFIFDYTQSMGSYITAIQTGAATLVSTIDTSSGASDYRISLVTADEENSATGGLPVYGSCTDYTNLPAAQKVANQSSNAKWQIITAWEMFQTNNGTSFTTELNKLNGGADGTCVQMGDGVAAPEPTDFAAQLITGASQLTGAFRSNVAKYVVIITDQLPGGTYDSFNNTVWAGIQQMIIDASNDGIQYFILGAGVDIAGTNSGVAGIYPWRELATQTGGSYNVSPTVTNISNAITAGCS